MCRGLKAKRAGSGSGEEFSPRGDLADVDDRWARAGDGADDVATISARTQGVRRRARSRRGGDHRGPAWRARAKQGAPGSEEGRRGFGSVA
jgi:hypothetical protein